MAKGTKTGGRVKGSQNKRTQATAAAIESAGISPLEYMLSILRAPEVFTDKMDIKEFMAAKALKLDAAKAAAPYVHPKLANIEVSGPDGGALEVKIVRFSNAAK